MQKGDIKTSYLSQKYIFNCNAWQLAILSQYNDATKMTYKDIQANTMIADEILRPQMALLVKTRVLLEVDGAYDLNLSEWFLFSQGHS